LRGRRTQQELAAETGLAVETISRWENGHVIQSRSHDKLLRYVFGIEDQGNASSDARRSAG
jgi:transcriptional regulator with XRE-family HTH domain